MKLLAITSCSIGVVNTYIAAEKIQRTARKMNLEIKVETRGISGVQNKINNEDLIEADALIVASDSSLNLDNEFEKINTYNFDISEAINTPETMLEKVLYIQNKKTKNIFLKALKKCVKVFYRDNYGK